MADGEVSAKVSGFDADRRDVAPGHAEPFGAVVSASDRDASGRFVRGNRAALVVGAQSTGFWMAHEAARRDIRRQLIADAGFGDEDAPRALQVAVDSIAQAVLLRDAAFARVVEGGGPLTSAGRARRAYAVWLTATGRVERYLRLVGLRRVPKAALTFEQAVAAAAERETTD